MVRTAYASTRAFYEDQELVSACKESIKAALRSHGFYVRYQAAYRKDGSISSIRVAAADHTNRHLGYLGQLKTLAEMPASALHVLIATKRGEAYEHA